MITKPELLAAIAEVVKPVAESTARIEQSLHTLASVELARTLYERTELLDLIKKHGQLTQADHEAFQAMEQAHAALEEDGAAIGWEARVEKHGQAKAEAMRAPAEKARQARVATINALDAFRAEHPVVAAIVNASKGR